MLALSAGRPAGLPLAGPRLAGHDQAFVLAYRFNSLFPPLCKNLLLPWPDRGGFIGLAGELGADYPRLDRNREPLFAQPRYFRDNGHLNAAGAELFSRPLGRELRGLLQEGGAGPPQ